MISPIERRKCAFQIGQYMIRSMLALERLSFDEKQGPVGFRWSRDSSGQETMDYLEFIARVTLHIPDKKILQVHP